MLHLHGPPPSKDPRHFYDFNREEVKSVLTGQRGPPIDFKGTPGGFFPCGVRTIWLKFRIPPRSPKQSGCP